MPQLSPFATEARQDRPPRLQSKRLLVLIAMIGLFALFVTRLFILRLAISTELPSEPTTSTTDSLLVPPENLTETQPRRGSRFAIAVKTGSDTAALRAPIQLITFLQREFPGAFILVGDRPGVSVGSQKVHDVYSKLYSDQDRLNQGLAVLNEAREKLLSPKSATPEKRQSRKLQRREQVVPDESSAGWKSDAHKNLPGFELLHKEFPDADWYVMLDDDTYLFARKLAQIVADLDPAAPHYRGRVMLFTGCDGIDDKSPWRTFAQGGAGILISRGALQRMLPVLDGCVERYRTCWAGDVRTALCLRDVDVLVQGLDDFHTDPPTEHYWWPSDPCGAPATFHHSTPRQMQKFFDLELRAREGMVTYADLMKHAFFTEAERVRKDFSRNGERIKTLNNVDEAADCLRECAGEAGCLAWNYDAKARECALLKTVGEGKARADTSSGVFGERYVCHKA